jgi:glycosyltransferase involved in cell wall biosynthesis
MTTSVLLTTDGTYPCYAGGVSVWCDQLIRQLRDIDFHVFAIGYSPSHVPVFTRPPNVVSQQVCNLWGAEQPGVREESFSAALVRRLRTTPGAIRSGFLHAFSDCIRAILKPERSSELLAEALMRMHRFFREHDYARTMSAEEVWDTYLRVCRDAQSGSNSFSVEDATICIRWLVRYLSVLAATYPVTDVVHTSMSGLAGIPGVLQKQAHGSMYVVTEHGIFLRELYVRLSAMEASLPCRRFLFSFYEAVARMNYYFADEVTSLCEFNRKWQVRMGADAERIRITPNGVDPNVFRPPSEADARPADGRPVVLTMARIYPLKGIDVLLEAARLVQDQIPNVRWRILGDVGDRPYYNKCLGMAESLGLAEHIEWGRTDNPAEEYRKADLFCLSSISEAMPYCVLEAMFSLCPVVATDVGGVSEMLAGTGEIATPRDPQALANAILRVLSPEGRARRDALVADAFERARAMYTIEKCSDRFKEIYGELADAMRVAAMSAAG